MTDLGGLAEVADTSSVHVIPLPSVSQLQGRAMPWAVILIGLYVGQGRGSAQAVCKAEDVSR